MKTTLRSQRLLAFFAIGAALLSGLRAAPVYETLTAFEQVPDNPSRGRLLRHTDGNFYGSSFQGGAQDFGTIYRVTPAGVLSVVVHFNGTSGAAKGRNPNCQLIADEAGFLWGTTQIGGTSDRGTVFKLNPATGALTTVVEFTGTSGTAKGNTPQAGLMSDGAGSFWGTTQLGGVSNRGTVFKLNAATGALTTVIEFTGVSGTAKGSNPQAALVSDGAGSFWGTTQLGGTPNTGTVFKVNMATGALTNVLDFPSTGATPRSPVSELVSDGAGNFWGTSPLGGASNFGTVYRVSAATGALTTVVQFTGNSGAVLGRGAISELVNDGAGNFWGTAPNGGTSNVGTIFKVRMATGVLSTVSSFTGNFGAVKGENPQAGLIRDPSGNFWGTTLNSGASPGGTVFRVNIASGALTTMAQFQRGLSNRGKAPYGTLVADASGNLWGTTRTGGEGQGTVYKVSPVTGALTTVVAFPIASSNNSLPIAGVVSDGAGFFWGTTSDAGPYFYGSVFKVNATTGALTTPVLFKGTGGTPRGSRPVAALMNDGFGFMWGTTSDGGTDNRGTVFKVNIASGAVTIVADFTENVGPVLGASPGCQLLDDGTGFLWGTTGRGGGATTNAGTVFKINRATGAFTSVVQFTGSSGAASGSSPSGGLTSDGAGNLWGATRAGGAGGFGTVFKIARATEVLTTVVQFTGSSGAFRGSEPQSPLTLDGAGNFWGMTNAGGTAGLGTIYKVSLSGAFTSVFSFTGIGGAVPGQEPFFQGIYYHTDGNLYGTVASGGFGGEGLIFRVRLDPTPPTGGTLTVTPASPVSPATVMTATAAGWTDANLPLSYEFLLDTVSLGQKGSAASKNFSAPAAPGQHTVTVRVFDALGAFAEVSRTFIVNVPPAGGLFTVSPGVAAPGATVQLSASGWTDPNTPLTYQFFLNDAPLGPAGASSAASFAAPAALGTYPLKLRVTDALGAFVEVSSSFVVNNPPVARASTLGAVSGSTAEISAAKLLRYASDPDGDTIQIIAVSAASAQGGTVTLLAGVIRYTTPADYSGPDSFTYTLRDSSGSEAKGTVNVTVAAAPPSSLNIVSITPTAAGCLIKFAGIPGETYRIQYRDALTHPWQLLEPPGDIVAGPNGLFEYEDQPNPKPASRFYRAIAP